MDSTYWSVLEDMISTHGFNIDRPKGSRHPKYHQVIYPLDYGFINNTASMDGGGIDIFVGEQQPATIRGIVCTIDRLKKDSEIKVIYGCTDADVSTIMNFLHTEDMMRAIYVPRDK